MRNKIVLGAIAVASAVVLAGCGGGGSGSAAPSEEAIDGEGQELTIWVDENREPAVEAAAADFEEETGATVTLVQKNFGDIRTDFISQVGNGEGPDITIGAHDWLGELVANGTVNTVDIGAAADELNPMAIEAMTYDGQLYALPYSLETIALIQNVDLVGDAVPATWDEMIAAGQAATPERPFVINTSGETGDGYNMYGFQTSFGAPVFVQDADGAYTTEVGMGGPNGEAFATWLGANGKNGTGIISTTVDYAINIELFNTGATGFTIQGPWAIGSFTDVPNLKVSPIPAAGPEEAAPFVGVQGFYVSSASKNALLAQEFLVNYLATEDAQRALYEADPRIPAWTTIAEEEASDPIIAGFIAASENGVPMPSIPEMGSVWETWNAAQAGIINGADPVPTWNTMVADLETKLAG